MPILSRLACLAAAAVVALPTIGSAAPPSGAASANGDESNGVQYQPSRSGERALETTAGATDPNAAAQDRELDRIGQQLLKGTPRAPAGSTDATGGGTTP